MEVLFVSAEPNASIAGAGELCAALPKALRSIGHRVTVVTPFLAGVDPTALALARRLTRIEAVVGDEKLACELYDGRTSAGVELAFLGHAGLFRTAKSLDESADPVLMARRAALFAQGVATFARVREPRADLVHAYGWPGALAAVAIQQEPSTEDLPTVLTLRDLDSAGALDADLGALLGFDSEVARSLGLSPAPADPVLAGLKQAGRVTTLSRSYAATAAATATESIVDALTALGDRLVGIVDGVDSAVWNPATDPKIRSRFDPADLAGRGRCRGDLQLRLELPIREDVPIFVAFASTDAREGYDLLAAAGAEILRSDLQLVVQLAASEDHPLRAVFAELEKTFPDRCKLVASDDDTLMHRLLSATDFVVSPTRAEPCRVLHLLAQRYGAIPITRRLGCAADTVVDCDARLETGTGILFDAADAQELRGAIQRGCAAYGDLRAFDRLRSRVMRVDHSWERAARLYEATYRELVSPRSSGSR